MSRYISPFETAALRLVPKFVQNIRKNAAPPYKRFVPQKIIEFLKICRGFFVGNAIHTVNAKNKVLRTSEYKKETWGKNIKVE